jgi:hypothetical protein
VTIDFVANPSSSASYFIPTTLRLLQIPRKAFKLQRGNTRGIVVMGCPLRGASLAEQIGLESVPTLPISSSEPTKRSSYTAPR